MRIIFIRHGQTSGDVEDRYGGDYNDSLSELGKNQAKELPLELKEKNIELIISSPLNRARETALILSQLSCPIIIEPGFKERNQYGMLSGMIKSEAKTKYPDLVEKLKDRLNTIEGAESYQVFSERITKAFQGLVDSNKHQCIAVIWHGGPMRVLFRDILQIGELIEIGDCAWTELDITEGKISVIDSKRLEIA